MEVLTSPQSQGLSRRTLGWRGAFIDFVIVYVGIAAGQ